MIFSTHTLHPRATEMLAGHGDLVIASALDAETLTREAREAEIVIVRANLPSELFAAAPKLRAAIRHGAGLDMIPMEAANAAGVLVANVPGANARSVAEHVLFVTLALLRRFRPMDRDLRAQGWLAGRDHANAMHELSCKTIGIVGMGSIGRHVASICHHGFGLSVLGTSRNMTGYPDFVRAVGLHELLRDSDIVVLACPLTPQTTGLLNREKIALMKPGALLVNVSRGPVIEEAALVEALAKGRIGGAALDVFVTQPLPADHPFFGFDNVIITPHIAGITEESMMRMGVGAAGEAIRVLRGDFPENLRNPEIVEKYRARFAA